MSSTGHIFALSLSDLFHGSWVRLGLVSLGSHAGVTVWVDHGAFASFLQGTIIFRPSDRRNVLVLGRQLVPVVRVFPRRRLRGLLLALHPVA